MIVSPTIPVSSQLTQEVRSAYNAPRLVVTRRIAIYESDGVTLWRPDDMQNRLIEGSIQVDADRDERRSLDGLVLFNKDGLLNQDSEGGFWYDKIIKVYRGLVYTAKVQQGSPVLVETNQFLNPNVGGGAVTYWNSNDGTKYPASVTTTSPIEGTYSIQTVRTATNLDNVPGSLYFGGSGAGGKLPVSPNQIIKAGIDVKTELAGRRVQMYLIWYNSAGTQLSTTSTGYYPVRNTVAGQEYRATIQGTAPANAVLCYPIVSIMTETGNATAGEKVWFDNFSFGSFQKLNGALPADDEYTYNWTGTPNASTSQKWAKAPYVNVTKKFEIQIGEFMIDSISDQRFPKSVTISGRDYTKKLMLDQFAVDTSFASGLALDNLVKIIATNGGITKFRLGATGVLIGSAPTFARKSSRWEAIKSLCGGLNVEVYFDREGYLVTRLFDDVSTSAPSFDLTMDDGQENIIDFQKATSDSNIFNHIVVIGTSEEETVTGYKYIAERENNDPGSPTCIAKIGRRTFTYEVSYITSQTQANDLANRLLKIKQLEDFNLSFSTVCLPWLEAGRVLGFKDPFSADSVPTRFLFSQFTIPLALGPLSGTGKRIVIVGLTEAEQEGIDFELAS